MKQKKIFFTEIFLNIAYINKDIDLYILNEVIKYSAS